MRRFAVTCMVLAAVVVSTAVGEDNTIILPGDDGDNNDGVSLGWRKDSEGNPFGYLIHGETVLPCDGDCDCPDGYSQKDGDNGEKICVKDEIEGLKFKDGKYYLEKSETVATEYEEFDAEFKNVISAKNISFEVELGDPLNDTYKTTVEAGQIKTHTLQTETVVCSLAEGSDEYTIEVTGKGLNLFGKLQGGNVNLESEIKAGEVILSYDNYKHELSPGLAIITNGTSKNKMESGEIKLSKTVENTGTPLKDKYFVSTTPESLTISYEGGIELKTKITAGNIKTPLVETDKILIDGWKLSTKVPDYVFEQDYQLPELSETEKYIKENKHLPEIPSAKEIEKNGMDMAEMNILLLKKVEELTLHAIDQDKRIKELEKKIISDNEESQTK